MVVQQVSQSKYNVVSKIILNIIFLIMIIILGFSLYILYLNLPGDPEYLDVNVDKTITENQNNDISEAKQFYSNMKFNHNHITYGINSDCNQKQKARMIDAFEELHDNIPSLTFQSVFSNPDIEVSCSEDTKENSGNQDEKKRYYIAGEGGAKEIIQTGRYHIINDGIIFLYQEEKKGIECEYPNVELHEVLHVFGFDHSEDKKSIMFPFLDSCDQILDNSIISELERLYESENLPELFFQNFTAIKKGRYLDFNLTVKNSGSLDSPNVSLTILDNEDVVETRDIGTIKFGAGITLTTTNLKLKRKNPDQIRFILDRDNVIEEINEANNVALISLDG